MCGDISVLYLCECDCNYITHIAESEAESKTFVLLKFFSHVFYVFIIIYTKMNVYEEQSVIQACVSSFSPYENKVC